jgi:hypothetical protein
LQSRCSYLRVRRDERRLYFFCTRASQHQVCRCLEFLITQPTCRFMSPSSFYSVSIPFSVFAN